MKWIFDEVCVPHRSHLIWFWKTNKILASPLFLPPLSFYKWLYERVVLMEKASPFSKQNNSPLRNLNAAELTFVSCQVHAAVGGGGLGVRARAGERCSTLNYKCWACHFWTLLKLSGNKMFFCGEGRILLPTRHVHTPAVSFVMRAAHGGCDSGECPCTVTLGGEVGQGRVSGAARVGQSTDLVMAPLYFFFLSLSADSFLVFFFASHFGFSSFLLLLKDRSRNAKSLTLVHTSLMCLCLACKMCPFPFLFSVCYRCEELSGVPARPV